RLVHHRVKRFEGRTGVALGAGYLDAHAPCQFLDRDREVETLVFHEESEGGAVRAAAEAVVETLLRADREGGGLFGVERAARLVFPTGARQGHARAHDLHDVRALNQVVQKVLGYPAAHLAKPGNAAPGNGAPGQPLRRLMWRTVTGGG